MSENPFAAFTPKKEWLVCVDSDGCAMDTMDSKHHQAFCPQLIRVYGLEEYAGLITPPLDGSEPVQPHPRREPL